MELGVSIEQIWCAEGVASITYSHDKLLSPGCGLNRHKFSSVFSYYIC